MGLFLERFARWRRLARQVSLSRCLEAVLTETHYADWLLTQPRGEQRYSNVQRLVALAQQFDQFQRQGLFRFLLLIEAQQAAETEPDVPAVTEDSAVRLMSIHQSKGLEFPVVAVADLGKPFNLSDLRAELILDERFGLCPQIKPPHTGQRYPSLPWWLARKRQTAELLGEELRLLYVAMTRARDTLILSGTLAESRFDRAWLPRDVHAPAPASEAVLAARSYLDWIGLWFAHGGLGAGADGRQGRSETLCWRVCDDAQLAEAAAGPEPAEAAGPADTEFDEAGWKQLQARLSWVYPRLEATRQAAKTSVSALRRLAAAHLEDDAAEGGAWSAERGAWGGEGCGKQTDASKRANQASAGRARRSRRSPGARTPSAVDVGNAHHLFLQHVSLGRVQSTSELKQEAGRLEAAGLLAPEQVQSLDFAALAAFWASEPGRSIRAQAAYVRRELAFTARFSPGELAAVTAAASAPGLEEEFVVVQGVVDLAVLLPTETWLLDFKTDAVKPAELAARATAYAPQLQLYARAFARIYHRPVTRCWLYFLARQQAMPVDV